MAWGFAAAYVAGGLMSSVGGIFGDNAQKERLEEQKKMLEAEKRRQLELMDLQFNVAKNEAEKNAANVDKATKINETGVTNDFNGNMNQLRLQQEAETQQWNLISMQNSQITGNELSQMAASGTRSSSMATAVDLERAVNASQLQLQQDQQRASDNYNLNNLLNGLQQNVFGIQQNRTAANDLRVSYAEGGNQFKLYSKSRSNQEAAYNDKISQINSAIDDIDDSSFGNFFTRFFSGGMAGASNYQSISNFVEAVKAPKYTSTLDTKKLSWNNLSTHTGIFGETYGVNKFTNGWFNPIGAN